MTARILVVDDIPANVKLLEARLMAEYFEVLTAADGMTALSICDQTQVDLILLDIMMPGIDGFEVCERLKHQPAAPHIFPSSWSPHWISRRIVSAASRPVPMIS
jgi:two-component system cell cycle response regulator